MKTSKVEKQTVYLDSEDEITSVIDKLKSADAKVVALVLPKRYATLQSTINLKLLKKASKNANKSVVLITSDSTVVPMAGSAGIHVAKTLQSKPKIPTPIKSQDEEITIESQIEGKANSEDEPTIDPKATLASLDSSLTGSDGDETIEVGEHVTADKPKKSKKNKKLKVPNFNKFRLKLILIALVIILLGLGWFFAVKVLPKANIKVSTNTSKQDSTIDFTATTGAEEVKLEEKILPAYKLDIEKASTEKVPTTGKKDVGKKSTGILRLTNCIEGSDEITIPAGTIFSASGLNFVSDKPVTLAGAIYQSGSCKSDFFGESKNVGVTASEGGSRYNLSARAYSVPGEYNTAEGSVLANGGDMAGGTSKIVAVVSKDDIESAQQQALDKLSQEASGELLQKFKEEQSVGIFNTLNREKVKATPAIKVGEEASEVDVAVSVTYDMHGVKREHFIKLIEADFADKIDTNNQAIQNTGIDDADIRLQETVSKEEFKLSLQTTVLIGPNLDINSMISEIAGKKLGETKDNISNRPGVIDVDVKYEPFWVFSTPNDITKINIEVVESVKDE